MQAIIKLLKGWHYAPRLVGLMRAAIEVGALAGLTFAGANLDQVAGWFPSLDSPEKIATFILIGGGIIRWLESEADQKIDPQQNRTAEARAAKPPQ